MDTNIIGWGISYGPCVYTNEDLCKIFDLPLRKAKEYEEMIGVRKRSMCIDHWNGGVQVIRDDQMATEAAKMALEVANIDSDKIDTIISVYTSMDYITPGVAERVQGNLKIVEGHTFNFVGGCAELINAFIVAKMLLENGSAKNVLVTTSDVANSYYKSFGYPYEWFLNGDSAGALILSSEHQSHLKVKNTNFKTIGRIQNLMPIPIFGMKEPCPLIVETKEVHPLLEKMLDVDKKYRWRRKEVIPEMVKLFVNNLERIAKELLNEVGGSLEETYILLPQLDMRSMVESAKRFEMDLKEIPLLLKDHGCEGTSAPISTFVEAYKMHYEFRKFKYVIMAALGINGSYGGVIFENVK